MTKIISVLAMTDDNLIGDREHNEMPWRLGEYKKHPFWDSFKPGTFRKMDMDHFKDLTTGPNYALLMGRATWESIPKFARPLEGRVNLILSTTMPEQEGVTIYRSFEEAVNDFKNYDQITAMGGESIYELMDPLASEKYITRIHKKFTGDVYLPPVNESIWKLEKDEPQLAGTEHAGKFSFEKYVRTTLF